MKREKRSNRPERAVEAFIYFIRFKPSLYKIGITVDWERRSKELKVGSVCKAIKVRRVKNPGRLEKIILQKYDKCNLPGSEYLQLNSEQVKDIKEIISDKSEYKQVFKDWDTGKKKNVINLEIALQNEPELLKKFENINSKKQNKQKLINKKSRDSWQKSLLIVFIFLIPPIFIALLIVEFIFLLAGIQSKGPLRKLFD